jgi:hypothetical protein
LQETNALAYFGQSVKGEEKKVLKDLHQIFFLFRAVAFFITNPRGENVPANSFGISNPDNSLQGPVM